MVAFHKVEIFTNISFTPNIASVFCFEGKSLPVGGNTYFDIFSNIIEAEKKNAIEYK